MKKLCIYCHKNVDVDEFNTCPECKRSLDYSKGIDKDDLYFCQKGLSFEVKRRDKGLTFLVVGILALILSAIFLFLSFRYNVLKVKVFTPLSFEFFIFSILITLSITFITIAIINLSIMKKNKTTYLNIIKENK